MTQLVIRVLIAEDQQLMREGLKIILDLEDGFEVVGEAGDGETAVAQTLSLLPDVVLMDIQMPKLNGVEATAQITAVLPNTHVIILTTFDYDTYIFDGIKAGASGYFLKDMPAAELLTNIRQVCNGESIVQPSIAARLIAEFSQQRSQSQLYYEALSDREHEILQLLAEGHSNRSIADQLYLAEGTVKNNVSSILAKLHAANRTQAVRIARSRGLV